MPAGKKLFCALPKIVPCPDQHPTPPGRPLQDPSRTPPRPLQDPSRKAQEDPPLSPKHPPYHHQLASILYPKTVTLLLIKHTRVGLARIVYYAPNMTVYLVIFLPRIPYICGSGKPYTRAILSVSKKKEQKSSWYLNTLAHALSVSEKKHSQQYSSVPESIRSTSSGSGCACSCTSFCAARSACPFAVSYE